MSHLFELLDHENIGTDIKIIVLVCLVFEILMILNILLMAALICILK